MKKLDAAATRIIRDGMKQKRRIKIAIIKELNSMDYNNLIRALELIKKLTT